MAMVLGCGLSATVSAQKDPCDCDPALGPNFRKEINVVDNSKYSNSFTVLFNRSFEFWESGEWKNDQALNSGGSYGIISGYFDASQNREDRHASYRRDSMSFKETRDISMESYKYYSEKSPDHKTYDTWLACKLGCPTFFGTFLYSTIANKNEVTITLKFFQADQTIKARIRSVKVSKNLVLTDANPEIRANATISGTNSYVNTYKWADATSDASVTVVVAGAYGAKTLIIPSPRKPAPAPGGTAQIMNGTINQNAEFIARWGDIRADPAFSFHHSPQAVPYQTREGQPEGPWSEAGSASTKCLVALSSDNDNDYRWSLNLTNNFEANSGPFQAGGAGYASPVYNTDISLPALSCHGCDWNLFVKLSSWVTNSTDVEMINKDVKINLNSGAFDTTFSVKTNHELSPGNFSIPHLKSGVYHVQMNINKVGVGSSEVPPNDIKHAVLQTDLSIEAKPSK